MECKTHACWMTNWPLETIAWSAYVGNMCYSILLCVWNIANGIFQVLALTIVSIGVAVATVTDLQFDLFGACIALAWIIPSAINKILWSSLQQQENWTALA